MESDAEVQRPGTTGPAGRAEASGGNKSKEYTGAIENELLLAVAAQLANRAENKRYYVQWAWFQGTGMINADFNINNGIDATTCKNDGQTVWTYNQGMILGRWSSLISPRRTLHTSRWRSGLRLRRSGS